MNRTHRLGIAAVALLLAAGAAVYTGFGPAPGGTGDTITDFPTATPDGSASSGESTAPRFAMTVERVAECGRTCRDVTVSLHNEGDEPASGVTVYTRVFAGRDTTDADDLVWESREAVGTLGGDESHTATRRVELSLRGALAVERSGGWITILTTVESDGETVTFGESRRVA